LIEMAGRAVIGRPRDLGIEHDPARARRRRHVDGLDVLLIGADVADMREGEGDDLPRIGGIGQDLLIAGHRGVEADLANGFACRTEAETFEHGAVGQHQEGGRGRLRPAGLSVIHAPLT
jgi:hypothetical protein